MKDPAPPAPTGTPAENFLLDASATPKFTNQKLATDTLKQIEFGESIIIKRSLEKDPTSRVVFSSELC